MYNGNVTVFPSGDVQVSGQLSGFDEFDFDLEGNSHRTAGGAVGTFAGYLGGAIYNGLPASLPEGAPPPTPFEINLTPVNVDFTQNYRGR